MASAWRSVKGLARTGKLWPFLFVGALVSHWGSGVAVGDDDIEQDLRRIFAQYDRADAPGCFVVAFRQGEALVERSFGMADLEHGVPLSSSSVVFEPLGVTHTHFHDDFREIVPNRAEMLDEAGALRLSGPGVESAMAPVFADGFRWRSGSLLFERDPAGRPRGFELAPGRARNFFFERP